MIVLAVVLVGALLSAWWMPNLLRRLMLRRIDPVLLILCWVLSIWGLASTVTGAVALLLTPGHGPAGQLLDAVHGCWLAVRHGASSWPDWVTGVMGVLALSAGLVRILGLAGVHIDRQRRSRQDHLQLWRVLGQPQQDADRVLWLEHREPLAYSVGGHPGLIVATTALSRLPETQLAAVLAHERAHVRGRHHLLMTWCQAVAKALPFVPLCREAPAAVRVLVELAADAVAARAWGAAAVRNALLAMHGSPAASPAPPAVDGVELPLRLRYLTRGGTTGRARQVLLRAAAGTTALVLPALAGVGPVLAAALLVC